MGKCEPKSVGFGNPSIGETKTGYALDCSSDEQSENMVHGYKALRYQTENYDYVLAFISIVSADSGRIACYDETVNKIYLFEY